MPFLTQLSVNKFRNIETVNIEPSRTLNFLYGENGAGKSSLLEAISFISRGKSFRTNLFRKVIKHDCEALILYACVQNNELNLDKLGIEKTRTGEGRIRVNDKTVHMSSELAKSLPVLVLNNISFELLVSEAKTRRKFFDWLVFHVKHSFAEDWKNYNRLIKQRNILLRRDKISYSEIRPWDKQLAQLAVRIIKARNACLEIFIPVLKSYLNQCEFEEKSTLTLQLIDGLKDIGKSGSDEERELEVEQALELNFDNDVSRGFTTIGPHRSDLKVCVDKAAAGDILSRGQQKIVITALNFAQAQVFSQVHKQSPVILFDDLNSELDSKHQLLVMNWIELLASQAFVTGTDKAQLERHASNQQEVKMFHVERGTVTEE